MKKHPLWRALIIYILLMIAFGAGVLVERHVEAPARQVKIEIENGEE